MPSPPPYTPSNLRSIHLLRALLREATYLPDSNARNYFRRYIVNRFKAYQPTLNASNLRDVRGCEPPRRKEFKIKRRPTSVINIRTPVMQKKAQKGLNYLRRANLGEPSCLEKILYLTYGRMGKRRYALLDELLKPDPVFAEDGTEVPPPRPAPLQACYYSDKRVLQFFDEPKRSSEQDLTIPISSRFSKLKTVLKTQVSQGISIGREIKRDNLKTPMYNVWERPMPIKRARNNVKRWYAGTMSRLLPPVPNDEWDQLRGLAIGEVKWKGPVPRRTPAGSLQLGNDGPFTRSEVILERGIALDKPNKADRPGGRQRPHNLTPRTMQRLYAKIFSVACKLEWNPNSNRWIARWGKFQEISPLISPASVDDSLFAGVDERGRVGNSQPSKTTAAPITAARVTMPVPLDAGT